MLTELEGLIPSEMTTLQDRIEELMKDTGWKNKDVASISGVSASAVSQWRGKGNKVVAEIADHDAAARLSAASRYEAQWIATGRGKKYKDTHAPGDMTGAIDSGARQAQADSASDHNSLSKEAKAIARLFDSIADDEIKHDVMLKVMTLVGEAMRKPHE